MTTAPSCLPDDVVVFIPSYKRIDRLKKCIESMRRFGHPTGPIHVVCNKTLDPRMTIPGVTFYRIQDDDWNEGKAFAACMVIARHRAPFFRYLLIVDDDVVFTSPNWIMMPAMMDYPEYKNVYAATACGDMMSFMGARLVKQLKKDGVCDTSISCGLLMVRNAAIEEAGIFAPAPCRVEYEYKLRLAIIGKTFACFFLSGFRHYRDPDGGTNRLFPRLESRKALKRKAFWEFLRRWTGHWKMGREFVCTRENILAKADNRFEVYINWARIARYRRGSVAVHWINLIVNRLRWHSQYTAQFTDWLRSQAIGLL